ncbi:NAD-glutamate dehydrogenase [Marinicella gelatinilytica]|uniref:NAD-glutamate dehydrogenase n=1 Tax=Marinicella gelatinilytica TaxID=2996017 RepID=UPI002260E099|nr:NAD-glutamate dehydrogenase [Marinicella gelatinilytica]MCX7543816.1 NAD-glutamate dehydrogenase [Marinicella gelatinilytica]
MHSLLTSDHKKFIKKFAAHLKKNKQPYSDSAEQLAKQLFTHMTMDEVNSHDVEYWVEVITKMISAMSDSSLKKPVIKVTDFTDDQLISHIFLVNDNIPFLVDSATMACAEFGLEVKLISHPIIQIQGEDKDRVLIDKPKKNDTQVKSLIYIEVSQIHDKKEQQKLQTYLNNVFTQIRYAVADWKPMLAKLEEAKDKLGSLGDDTCQKSQQKFLDWLANDNFTFLGYRRYQKQKDYLVAEEDSGLGLLSQKLDADSNDASQIKVSDYKVKKQSDLVVLTKVNKLSKIHRKGNLDYIGVLETNDQGEVVAEHRFIGLLTSQAMNTSPLEIPYIKTKIKQLIKQFAFEDNSHSEKMLMHIIDSFPRDEVMQSNTKELFYAIYQSLAIQEKVTTQVIARIDKFGRYGSFMIYVPRDLFNTKVRLKIQKLVTEAVDGVEVEYAVSIDDSHYARLYLVIRDINKFDRKLIDELKQQIIEVVKTWEDQLRMVLIERFGNEQAQPLMAKFKGAFPVAYTEDVSPRVASYDLEHANKLTDADDLQVSLYMPRVKQQGEFRFKVFRFNKTMPLSEVLPDLENLGLQVVSERPYEWQLADGRVIWVQDFDLNLASGASLKLELVRERFHSTFAKVSRKELSSNPLNKLVILGGLNWRQIYFINGLVKYLLQTGLPYSRDYIVKALVNQPHISRWIVELFTIRFSPALDQLDASEIRDYFKAFQQKFGDQMHHLNITLNENQQACVDKYFRSRKLDRESLSDKVEKVINALLVSVSSQDEDRIIRYVTETIRAVIRTNFFQKDAEDKFKPAMSIKINSSALSFIPKPIPYREIFVYSPDVEAIHLRMGEVARGGLRWSDRYEDFRTEVLGLMKAQHVKNSIIVPVGSKGGFVVKRLPQGDRDAVMAEVKRCYQIYIGSMLDITDNIVNDQVVYPDNVVRYDDDDPYLVVAADKGTATFSDIANGISIERNFWLGDAFASGGSVGYDHKGMGITARGAWESVKRHFREMNIDCQKQDFSVVGIGDMGGDVFGNGMLLSKHICLKAAFNHMHIFLDPNPDSASTWKERKRLFEMPRSSWEDFNQKLISKGGGVYSRFDKAIPLSKEVKDWLKLKQDDIAPQDLIKKLLQSEVDLIWNGGIGTYVKSSEESHADVGDSANNSLRVNGNELRCLVFGEGGNLGMTQRGRIEYAKTGGRLNADFIDNSAGVDCSDHEVNIKILLQQMVKDGQMDLPARNKLLADMTSEVSRLVLTNNYRQNKILSFMLHVSPERIGAKAHLIKTLENNGLLDREVEFLPSEAELKTRQQNGEGLYSPELCVVLSYSKIDLFKKLLASDVLEDPWLRDVMVHYFPKQLQSIDAKYLDNHQLKREIIGTVLTSQIVDRMGATFMMRMNEDTGADVSTIALAYFLVVELFNLNDLWQAIDDHDGVVMADDQLKALKSIWSFVRHGVRWTLNNIGHNIDLQAQLKQLQSGVNAFKADFEQYITPADNQVFDRELKSLADKGFHKKIARQLAALPYINAALDVVKVANDEKVSVKSAADMYFPLGQYLNLVWLNSMVEKLPVDSHWHVHARGDLRDDLSEHHAELTAALIRRYGTKKSAQKVMDQWLHDQQKMVDNVKQLMTSIKSDKQADYATVMVAVNSLSNLVSATR